jgi:hypothetical protein
MKGVAVFLISIGSLLPIVADAQSCAPAIRGPDGLDVSPHPADPKALVEAWLPPIERLYSAIPSLSPREEQWLGDEEQFWLSGTNPERWYRAMRSTTYAIKQAKLDVGSLLGSLRVLSGRVEREEPRSTVEDWALFAYTLIEYDAPAYLARLQEEGVIQSAEIPQDWTVFHEPGFPLDEALRARRLAFARHILVCIIPQVSQS